jgi:RNA polymerase sigma factor (sigma-70 family)
MTDLELLSDYVRTRSEQAFATLVERYIRLVHSACWRQLADVHRAEDATQMVFELLSRKAAKLRHAQLAGWLLTAAHFTCANLKRAEHRRQRREQGIAMPPSQTQPDSPDHSETLQWLDAGLMRLGETDRQALVLRFMQEQPLSQVGQTLGITEDAARKRVQRGLEKLRDYLQAHGITTETAALSALMADRTHLPPIPQSLTPRIVQACRVQVPSPAWTLSPKAAVAAGLIFAAAAAVTGWGIFGSYASATQPADLTAPAPAPQAASPPPAPVPPTSPVTTLDFSTPDNVLSSLCRAMLSADSAGTYACLVDKPHQPLTALDAAIEGGIAERRMILAAQTAYGDAASQLRTGVPFTTVLQAIIMMRRIQGITVPIAGDTATMHVELPDTLMRAIPSDAAQGIGQWSGKPIYFVLRDGNWRLDAARSIRWAVSFQHSPSGPSIAASDAQTVSIASDMTKVSDQIARRIAAGDLPQAADAEHERGLLFDEWVMNKHHLTGLSTFVLPASPFKP